MILSSVLSCPKLFLADEDLVLVSLVLGVMLLAAPSHPFGNGGRRIKEVGALPDYGTASGTKDAVHLKEHVLHLAPAMQLVMMIIIVFCTTSLIESNQKRIFSEF